MQHHRFKQQFDSGSLLRAKSTQNAPSGFVFCPLAWALCSNGVPAMWQQQIYQAAFREAQAVVRPSLVERDLLASWN
jgi:hypothetical protein